MKADNEQLYLHPPSEPCTAMKMLVRHTPALKACTASPCLRGCTCGRYSAAGDHTSQYQDHFTSSASVAGPAISPRGHSVRGGGTPSCTG